VNIGHELPGSRPVKTPADSLVATVDVARARVVLGVRAGAGPDETERAFRALAAHHHPDRGGDPARFRELVDAREALRRRNGQGVGSWGPRPEVRFIRDLPWWLQFVQAVLRRYRGGEEGTVRVD
jgi:hypothetical protein